MKNQKSKSRILTFENVKETKVKFWKLLLNPFIVDLYLNINFAFKWLSLEVYMDILMCIGEQSRVEYTSVANPADRSLINRSHYQATPECVWWCFKYVWSIYMNGAWNHHPQSFPPTPDPNPPLRSPLPLSVSLSHFIPLSLAAKRIEVGKGPYSQPVIVLRRWYVIYKCPREMTRSSISSLKHNH